MQKINLAKNVKKCNFYFLVSNIFRIFAPEKRRTLLPNSKVEAKLYK